MPGARSKCASLCRSCTLYGILRFHLLSVGPSCLFNLFVIDAIRPRQWCCPCGYIHFKRGPATNACRWPSLLAARAWQHSISAERQQVVDVSFVAWFQRRGPPAAACEDWQSGTVGPGASGRRPAPPVRLSDGVLHLQTQQGLSPATASDGTAVDTDSKRGRRGATA